MEVNEIWNTFNVELRSYIRRRVSDESMVDDIVQDVFEKVIKNIQKLNEIENIQEYLYKITRNTIMDSFRARKLVFRELEVSKIEDSFQSNALIESNESESLNSIISKCCMKPFIEKLPVKYRDALVATEINNVSQKELAEKLDISYSGAKSRVQRGREKLKNLLQECCDFEHDAYGNLMQPNSKECDC